MNKQKSLQSVVTSRLVRNVAIALILLIVFFCFPNFVSGDCGHDHSHDNGHHHEHIEEPANFKWTREANEGHSHSHHEPEHEHEHHHEHKHHTENVQGKHRTRKTTTIF